MDARTILAGLGVAVLAALPAQAADLPNAAQVFARVAAPAFVDPAPATPPVAAVRAPNVPAWQRFAVAPPVTGGKPRIAVVIDDVGVQVPNARKVVALPGPLTVALMTYALHLRDLAAAARGNGHELLLHVPMEPEDGEVDPGPNVLASGLGADELHRRIEWALERVDGVVGINNHMGSRFTADRRAMDALMAALARRGLLFLDSLTTNHSVGRQASHAAGVPYLARDVFLDNDDDVASIWRQITELEAVARRDGTAIAIGHPRTATIEVLAQWLPAMAERGFALVPLSALLDPPPAVMATR